MSIAETCHEDNAELKISGDFSFSDCSEFRLKLMNFIARKVKSLRIDISQLNAIDSAGLGMFLVALSDCKSNQIDLSLYKPQGNVKILLEVTKSYDRFKIID